MGIPPFFTPMICINVSDGVERQVQYAIAWPRMRAALSL
jgi:hypothetical protein